MKMKLTPDHHERRGDNLPDKSPPCTASSFPASSSPSRSQHSFHQKLSLQQLQLFSPQLMVSSTRAAMMLKSCYSRLFGSGWNVRPRFLNCLTRLKSRSRRRSLETSSAPKTFCSLRPRMDPST